MVKRFVITLTILALVFSAVSPAQLSADTGIGYEGRICRDLGILKGETGIVDRAYLETRPSRLQAAIMFLRLKGLEEEALAYSGRNNFKDADAVLWKQGRNVLAYLKNHPELGWIGDGTNFLPYSLIDARAYYKVLLESLGYRQKIDGDGDFEWSSVLDFAAEKGLHKVSAVRTFTVESLAIATVEALQTKMKNSARKLLEYLVEIGDVDRDRAEALDLYSGKLEAEIKAVKAISNSKVEVIFKEAVDGSEAADEDLYDIRHLNIKGVSIKNKSSVIIDTSAMSEGTTYTLVFNGSDYSFRGLRKDSQAPRLISAECKDTDLVELSFDRVLDNKTAQDTDTYSIANVVIKSAELDSTNTKVRLVTGGIQTGRSYELKIFNIKNGDGVITKLITKRFTGKKDTAPPKFSKLTVLNNEKLLLEFTDSSGLNKASVEDEDNYRITSGSGELEVVSAKAKDRDDDGLWDSVELGTEEQTSGRSYTLIIQDIADNSVLKNRITKEIKKDFRGKAVDKTGPVVERNPKAITGNIIEIVFKDTNALDVESACDPGNYELDDDLDIQDIKIKDPSELYSEGGRTVHIYTSGMDKSETYTIVIKGVCDEFGNELKASSGSSYKKYRFKGMAEDNTPPYVTFVECVDSKTVEIKFDNQLEKASAENTSNYRIDGLALVTKARLQSDGRTVRLTVSSLSSDRNHKILMSNISDLSGNSMSNVSVSVVYNGSTDDTDAPEVDYIDAVNEEELWVHFDEEVYASAAQLKASGITFNQAGNVLEDGTAVVFKASTRMEDREYKVTSMTGIRDLRNNAYKHEHDFYFAGTGRENDPPEVDTWDQVDARTFRVVFTEPVLLIGNGVSGIKNPSGVSLSWSARLNPEEKDSNEAYSTVDFIASKEIPAGREYKFNFTVMVSDYVGRGVYDEGDGGGASNATVLEAYLEDDEDPYIEYVEAVTRTRAQIVFSEAISKDRPGTYKIKYEDEYGRLKYIDILRTDVDSEDGSRVNILTEDEMSQDHVYTLIPLSAAADIAGNRLDTRNVEIDFDGSNIMSSEYIQGVEFQGAYSFKVTKSSRIYSSNISLYELDSGGSVSGGNLADGGSVRVYDNVHRVVSKRPLLRDLRYKVMVDGLEYRFYGCVQNGDIGLELPERKITFDGMDVHEHYVKVFRAVGGELEVIEENGKFLIKASKDLQNGEWLYIYAIRESDDAVIYGAKVKVEGMPTASSSKKITEFGFRSLEPDAMGSIDEENKRITITVPYGTDVRHLAADFKCSEAAVVEINYKVQSSGHTVNDFSKEVIYTVIAEDGTRSFYSVIVTVDESRLEKRIKSFVLEEPEPGIAGTIDEEHHTINLKLPWGTELGALKPTIEVSPGAVVSPASGIPNDFSGPVEYTVIAADGSRQSYTVNAARELSPEKKIIDFSFPGISSGDKVSINNDMLTIDVLVPYGTDRTRMKAAFTVSRGASVKAGEELQISGETEKDFSGEVVYTVVAEDGTKAYYTIKVNYEESIYEKRITGFTFEALKPGVSCVIDQDKHSIELLVPYGTVLTALSPTVDVSPGTTVAPASEAVVDFTAPVEYKVTAPDGSSVSYTVTVTPAAAGEKRILEFGLSVGGTIVKANIDQINHRIIAEVPEGTDLTNLTAVFTCLGKSVHIGDVQQISGKTLNSFENELEYKVTAYDETTDIYTVTVTVK